MEVLLLCALLGVITGYIAHHKGYSFFRFWLYGALLFIVALPWVLLMKPNSAKLEEDQLKQGMKKCPSCAELVKAEASICRFCQKELM